MRLHKIRSTDRGKSQIPDHYRAALNEVGFIWDPMEHERQRVLKALREFVAENGHVNVIVTYKCWSDGEEKFPLGQKLQSIRLHGFGCGTVANPTPYRVKLEGMGVSVKK